MICPTSGTEIKQVPAGVSKTTGKPYAAFLACGVKFCKGPHTLPSAGSSQITTTGGNFIPKVEAHRDFDKENIGKCQSLFLAAFIQSGKTLDEAIAVAPKALRLAEIVVKGQVLDTERLVDELGF